MTKAAFIFVALACGASPSQAQELTLNQLSDLIFNPANKVTSIEDVLQKLPPSLRTNYVLMVKSKSLHEGTPENPRVIMFGKRGEIFVTFNGGEGRNKYGGNTIETIQYHKENHSYEFREYVFKTLDSKDESDETPARSNSHVVEFHNPNKCLACHGNPNARINWEPYPKWPGALPESFRVSPYERTFLKNFIATSRSHPRYKFLMGEENLAAMNDISMAAEMDLLVDGQRQTWLLDRLRETKDFEKYQFAVMGALLDCHDVESFVPANVKQIFDQVKTRAAFTDEVIEDIKASAPSHDLFLYGPEGARIIGTLRWLLETRDVNVGFWGSSFQSRYLFTAVPEVFYPPVIDNLLTKSIGEKGPPGIYNMLNSPLGKKALLTDEGRSNHFKTCEKLKKLSLERF